MRKRKLQRGEPRLDEQAIADLTKAAMRLADIYLERGKDFETVTVGESSDGGAADYYRLPPHAAELRHLISHVGMSKSRGDVFKACYRLGEKNGASVRYDLKKMLFFVLDLMEMYSRGERL